jgi:hypothetical protein
MKKIIQDFIPRGFPANENFLQFLNEELHNDLLMLCRSLYPDSENKAYVLSGAEVIIDGIISEPTFSEFSQGIIYYNNEIFFVPYQKVYTGGTHNYGLIEQENIYQEKFEDGIMHDAYRERKLIWTGNAITGALLYNNLLRRDFVKRQITNFEGMITPIEAKVILNNTTETLMAYLRLSYIDSQTLPLAQFETGIKKQGFLGIGKVSNTAFDGVSADVFVYQNGTKTVLAHRMHPPGTIPPPSTVNALVSLVSGKNDIVTLYINLMHER